MVLDSQSLLHLNILESPTEQAGGKGATNEGSLFSFINHCKTPFGKRQLKRWLMAPLMNPKQINERLDSVTDLMCHQYHVEQVRANLCKLPDLEKLIAKVFTYSIKHRCKAVYFEDVSLIKLKELKQLLSYLVTLPEAIKPLTDRT